MPSAEADAPAIQRQASPAQAAWLRYRAELDREHEEILKLPETQDSELRAQALYYLQSLEATAHLLYIAPRHQYPAFYVDSVFQPMLEVSWGIPNPDFHYRWAWLDGARSYRVWGNKRGSFWATIQVYKGFWGDEVQGNLGNIDFDDVPTDENGNFEFWLGPNPPAETNGQMWIKTDPALPNITLNLREVFNDWEKDETIEIHIEILDRKPGAGLYFDEAELAIRIDRATKFLAYNYGFTLEGLLPGKPGYRPANIFVASEIGVAQGGNPLATYSNMNYNLKPDEALIIEMAPTQGHYWGIQLLSLWKQTTEWIFHKSSINGVQAHIDADGAFRGVLADSDPGVPNWIDTAGLSRASALLRWYKTDGSAVPSTKVVKLAEVRDHLPKDTPVVTPAQRAEELQRRSTAALRRWNR